MKLKTIVTIYFALLTTAAVAAAEPDAAGQAARHRTAQELAYRVQAIRDMIGVQCQRLALPDIAKCETRDYNSYYKILDGIKRAESSNEAMIAVSNIISQLEAKIAVTLEDLESSAVR
jgi:hypothetical protein